MAETITIEKKRLTIMQWGVVVAIVGAAAAVIVPFAVQAQSQDSTEERSIEDDIKQLLTKTERLEATQDHLKGDIEEIKSDVKAIDDKVQAVLEGVVETNRETVERIMEILEERLPDPS